MKDAQDYARHWWKFAKTRNDFRKAAVDLRRFIGTTETAKHRIFKFIEGNFVHDHMVIGFAFDDGFVLGVLSSRIHNVWSLASGGTLEDRPRYSKSRCFDPFPFPAADDGQKQRIRALAEDLDAHRKRVLAEHPHLTLTGLYNVLERLRGGTALDAALRRTFDDGLVLILKELHDRIDAAVAEAYGWPADVADDEILARLVALNQERAAEEADGLVRWLRLDYQVPRFGSVKDKAELGLAGGAMRAEAAAPAGPKPAFPAADAAQTAVVMAALAHASGPLDAAAIAARFKQGWRVAPKVAAVLASLHRMGLVGTADGGSAFALQCAA